MSPRVSGCVGRVIKCCILLPWLQCFVEKYLMFQIIWRGYSSPLLFIYIIAITLYVRTFCVHTLNTPSWIDFVSDLANTSPPLWFLSITTMEGSTILVVDHGNARSALSHIWFRFEFSHWTNTNVAHSINRLETSWTRNMEPSWGL